MKKQLTAEERDIVRERELLRLGQRYGLIREAIRYYNAGGSPAEFMQLINFHRRVIAKRLGMQRRYSFAPY